MTNTLVILLYSPLFLCISVILIDTLRNSKHNNFSFRYCILYILILTWIISDILCHCIQSHDVIRFIYDFRLVIIGLLSVVLLEIFLAFYNIKKYVPKWFFYVVYSIPTITFLLTLTSNLHSLMIVSLDIKSLTPIIDIEITRGIWFFFYFVHAHMLLLLSAGIIFSQFILAQKSHKGGSLLLFLCMLIFCSGAFVEAFGLNKSTMNFTLICGSISAVLLYFTTISNGRRNYLHIFSGDMFNITETL